MLMLSHILSLPSIASLILLSLSPTRAYIPAVPINDTSALNLTDNSQIAIAWNDPLGVYSGRVSYQLQADVPTGGKTAGALVHFTESMMGPNISTGTPWIAYISCDVNETGASQEWDIFTLARDRGAVSALLYTATSQSCLLTQEYITDYEKPLDVFATKTVQVARVIDNQWAHTNDSLYYFNSTLLNQSAIDVNNSLAGNAPPFKTYLIGTLTARNSTGQATPTDIPNATTSAASAHKKGTSKSMIALYVIIGLISTAFILMIVVGARRALRHPERYGRREATDEQGPQSTAGGLAQAILDTFPIIKFNRSQPGQADAKRLSSERGTLNTVALPSLQRSMSNIESPAHGDRLSHYSSTRRATSVSWDDGMSAKMSVVTPSTSRRTSRLDLDRAMESPLGAVHEGKQQDSGPAIDEQCPICLLDFETGDDLRVLPCEIGHVYHQACIDPWLLKVSSSCPLCRKDFNPPPPRSESPNPPSHPDSPPLSSGFPRYLAFMRRERRGRARSDTNTTDSDVVGRGRRREADQTGPGGY